MGIGYLGVRYHGRRVLGEGESLGLAMGIRRLRLYSFLSSSFAMGGCRRLAASFHVHVAISVHSPFV